MQVLHFIVPSHEVLTVGVVGTTVPRQLVPLRANPTLHVVQAPRAVHVAQLAVQTTQVELLR